MISNLFLNGAVSLSFDDGWRSVYENALLILERSGIKSTQFIISGRLDERQFPQYMSLEHIKEFEKLGHEIGCHTASHKHLTQESQSIIESEIFLSLKYLKNEGLNITTFSYPFGEYDKKIIEKVKQAGFIGARSTIKGYNTKLTDPFLLKRQAVKVDTPISQVKGWIDKAQQKNIWLILSLHQIDYEGRALSTTPEILSQITNYILDRKITTLTIREGLNMMRVKII